MEQAETKSSKPFRVVVVGAGIVGLSLSHALQLANIDHVVLEKHDKVVSIRGAALIIWPSVARIFDQFGILDKIHSMTTPLTAEYRRWPDGTVNTVSGTIRQIEDIFNTPNILYDRMTCVTILHENLPDQSYIHTGRKMTHIEHTPTGVRVHLVDGSFEEGDMVIGADGVHSPTRSSMWEHAAKTDPQIIPDTDKEAMFSEYTTFFGVSPIEDRFGLGPAESHVILGYDQTKLLFTQNGTAYWAVIFKTELSRPPKRVSNTEEDAQAAAKRFADIPMTDKVKVKDLWKTNTRHGLIGIEEGLLTKWHAGRIVLVGDSAHKMTPDIGLGANMAIESAVSLCNLLHRQLASTPNRHMTPSELSALFTEYQNSRYERVKAFSDVSGQVTRMNSYQTWFGRFFTSYLAPYLMKMQASQFAHELVRAPKLEYAPLRTMDDGKAPWRVGREKEKEEEDDGGKSWLLYALVTSTVGAGVAWAMSSRLMTSL